MPLYYGYWSPFNRSAPNSRGVKKKSKARDVLFDDAEVERLESEMAARVAKAETVSCHVPPKGKPLDA